MDEINGGRYIQLTLQKFTTRHFAITTKFGIGRNSLKLELTKI